MAFEADKIYGVICNSNRGKYTLVMRVYEFDERKHVCSDYILSHQSCKSLTQLRQLISFEVVSRIEIFEAQIMLYSEKELMKEMNRLNYEMLSFHKNDVRSTKYLSIDVIGKYLFSIEYENKMISFYAYAN